jgi:bacterioferritin-associated ferredoxin
MIVCVCNNVSDRDIRNAVRCGVTTVKGLRDELGVGACCGKCGPCAKKVLKDAQITQESLFSPLVAVAA